MLDRGQNVLWKWVLLRTTSFFLAGIFSFGCGSKGDEAIIARVNGEALTAGQFRQYLLREFQSPARVDTLPLATKYDLLERLIDERLMVQAARTRGIHRDGEILKKVEDFRRKALVSALIDRQVVDKVVTKRRLEEFYRKYAGELRLRYIKLRVPPGDAEAEQRARERIQALWKRARAGESFAQLARDFSEDGNTAARGGDLGYVRWGGLPADFQEQAFALDIGELSTPIRGRSGYYLLKLEDRVRGSFDDERERMKWQLKAVYAKRIRMERQAYFDKLLDRYGVEFRRGNYRRFASLVKRPRYPFENIVGENRQIVLASFRGGQVTAGDLVDYLGRQGANYRWDDRNINEWTRALTQLKVAVAEAERLNLDVSLQVRQYEDTLLRERVEEIEVEQRLSVSDEEIAAYFNAHRDDFEQPEMVRVREILVTDPIEAEEVAGRAKNGADFASLASIHSLRSWARQRGGDLGFFPRSKFPEIAQVAFKMRRRGEVAGPIVVPEGYSVIQFLERRPSRPQRLNEATPKIRELLLEEKRQERRKNWLTELREKSDVQINEPLFVELFKVR